MYDCAFTLEKDAFRIIDECQNDEAATAVAYKFPGGAPSTTPAANATDTIAGVVWTPTLLLCTFIGNFG